MAVTQTIPASAAALTPIGNFISLAGTTLSAIAQMKAQTAQLSAIYFNKAQAELEESSIRFANSIALDALDSKYRETVQRLNADASEAVGTQKAVLAANGIDIGSGTARDLIDDTYNKLSEDVNALNRTRLSERSSAIYNSEMQAMSAKYKAELLGMQYESQKKANQISNISAGLQIGLSAFQAVSSLNTGAGAEASAGVGLPSSLSVYDNPYSAPIKAAQAPLTVANVSQSSPVSPIFGQPQSPSLAFNGGNGLFAQQSSLKAGMKTQQMSIPKPSANYAKGQLFKF
jgi:hypothetical protein